MLNPEPCTELNLVAMPLFNPNGDDSKNNQRIIGGNPTGISNMNENKFAWTNTLYRRMLANHWIPEKVSLVKDKVTIKQLTEEENEATMDTLSFLIFLDSFQCLNLPRIANYITSPAIRNLITIQEFQEVIHTQSYQYILDALYPMTQREAIYNRWRYNPALKRRIDFVVGIATDFERNPTEKNFKRVLVMNYILESIYFYQGFSFFDQLASRDKLVETDILIDYIRTDEITHIVIFLNLIKEMFTPDDYVMLREMVLEGGQHEIEWSHDVYGDKILGINKDSSTQSVHYLVNHRLHILKQEMPYPEQGLKNPYAHLAEFSKGNFFEAAAIVEYDRADSISGWDTF